MTFGHGLRMSLRAARRQARRGTGAQVPDLRPGCRTCADSHRPAEDRLREAPTTGRLLVAG